MSTTPPPPPAAPAPPGRPHGTDSFFDSLRRSGVVRTRDRWIGGVAGGVARRLGVDPLLVRGILVVLTIFGGLALLAYGVAWALLPEESDGRIHLQEAIRGRFDAALAGAAAFVVVGLARPAFWFDPHRWAPGWVIALGWIGLVATLVVVGVILASRPARPPAPPTPPPGWAPPAGPDQTGTPMSTTTDAGGAATPDGAPTTVLTGPDALDPTATYPAAGTGTAADAATSAYPTYPQPAYQPPAYAPPAGGAYPGGPYATAYPPAAPPVTTAPYAWQPPPAKVRTPGPGPVLVGIVLALCLFAGAGVLVAERLGAATASTALTIAGISLALLGLGVLVAGVRGRRSGVLGGLAILVGLVAVPAAAVVATVPTWGSIITDSGVVVASDEVWAPTTVDAAQAGYEYSVGQVRVDLTGVPLTAGELVTVPVSAGAGSTTVVVPTGEPVEVHVRLGAGDISSSLVGDWTRTSAGGRASATTETPSPDGRLTRSELSGTDLDLTLRSPAPGATTLVVTVDAGLGDVTIEES